jgi:hypothetical protein
VSDEFERVALREFRQELGRPSPEALRRVRDLVTQAGTVPAPAQRSRPWVRWGAPVAVTVVVLGLVLGTVAVVSPATLGSLVGALPLVGRTDSRDSPGRASEAEHAAAVEALTDLARTAEGTRPVTIKDGQELYVRGRGEEWTPSYTHEMWLDVNGAIPLMIRRADGSDGFTVGGPEPTADPSGTPSPVPADSKNENMDGEIARARAELAEQGPSLNRPTPAYLASLPTDPQPLLDLMKEQFGPSAGDWSVDHGVFDQTRNLLYTNEPLLTGAVRAAIYRALALLPGTGSSGQVTYHGQRYVTIWFTERGERQAEFLFDPTTGRVAGEGPVDRAVLWHHAVVDRVGDVPAGLR